MILYVLGLIGVGVFAISGCLAAGRKGLDWVGVLALAVATAVGGGTCRDVLLNRDAVFWIADPNQLWVIVAVSFVTIFYVRYFKPPMKALLIADAFGLALFAIIGAQIAEAEQASPLIVVVMGVITGAAGGVIRDVLLNETPILFRASEPLYSVAALAGIVLYLSLQGLGLAVVPAAIAGMVLIAAIRLAAIIWKIGLPVFQYDEEQRR